MIIKKINKYIVSIQLPLEAIKISRDLKKTKIIILLLLITRFFYVSLTLIAAGKFEFFLKNKSEKKMQGEKWFGNNLFKILITRLKIVIEVR